MIAAPFAFLNDAIVRPPGKPAVLLTAEKPTNVS
jgi:hypothetical protein